MRTSAHYGANNLGFFEIYGVSARTRGSGVTDEGANVPWQLRRGPLFRSGPPLIQFPLLPK